jgi:ribonuclease P protein component
MDGADGCPERTSSEENVSAQQSSPGSSPWLPPSHGKPCRAGNPPLSSAKGSATARSVIQPLRTRSAFGAFRGARTGRGGAVRARVVTHIVDPDGVGVAYALNRKVGGAVTRNRIRRRMRSVMTGLARRGDVLEPGAAYLLTAEAEAASCPFPVLEHWVESAVRGARRRSLERTPR